MNAERLLEVYEQISEAPDAIARLRRFVLDLAVRGKLLEQDVSEAPEQVGLEPYTSDAPYELPANWRWMRIGDQLDLLNGMAFKPTDWISEGLRIVRIQNLNNPDATYNLCDPAMARDRSLIDNGSFLISWSGTPGTSFGAFIWDRGPAVLNQHIFRCDFQTDAYTPEFLKLAINGRLDEMIEKAHGGVGLRHITKGKLQAMLIAVPPLAEQHRIVAKVDELMTLCDRLEEARKTREEVRDKLTAASLARLTAPDTTAEDFPTHAAFALEALPALTKRPDQIKTLRQTILNLAVRGKLVEQDPADAHASELLKEIAEERAELIKLGEVGKQKPLLPVEGQEAPFSLPESWAWCRLGSLVLASDAGWSPRTENHARVGDEWGVLKVSAVSWDHFDPEANKQVLPGTEPRLQAQVRKGDFLISRANTAELVARAVLVREEPKNLMMSDKIVRLRLVSDCDHKFAWLVNNYSDYGRDYYAANATGVSPSMKNVSRAVILNLPIPLPPLDEQHRIVAKVDALMALCDRLEAALTTTDTTRTRLLEALLHEALEPAADLLEAAE